MRAVDLIRKKRDGQELSRQEVEFLIRGYGGGEVPDYQVSAFLMAVFFRGMSDDEMVALTESMMRSGDVLNLDEIPGKKVDKHSTGGVGDKTSLIIAPLVAAAGVPVPMISGRGLGHTGGTLDKLESIPGFRVDLSSNEFKSTLKRANVALIGQTAEVAPADKKIYALRDVTSTVESIPLIVASIMSKKLAEGIDALVLDVKTGSGAFMKTEEASEKLARALVDTGRKIGKQVVAFITDMDQPLGSYVGNSLEVIESVETLKGNGPEDLSSLCIELAAQMLVLGSQAGSLDEGRERIKQLIRSGAAVEKFKEVVARQGGDPKALDDYDRLPKAKRVVPLASVTEGFVKRLDAEKIGKAVMVLGAGREKVDSQIDHSVGIVLKKKRGDRVKQGEALCLVHYNNEAKFKEAAKLIMSAYEFSDAPVQPSQLIKKVIT